MVPGCYWTLPCGDFALFIYFFLTPSLNFFFKSCVVLFFFYRVSYLEWRQLRFSCWAMWTTYRRVTAFWFPTSTWNNVSLSIKTSNLNVFLFSSVSFLVSGLSQRSLRVCQAKRVAPPIVPESATASSAAGQQQQQQHRHSGSSFDSGGSAESSSGGYCSGTGSLSSCHAPSSSAWSQAGSDQRSSIGLDDAFLPPPPSSPVGHANNNVANKHNHMYNRGKHVWCFFLSFFLCVFLLLAQPVFCYMLVTLPKLNASLATCFLVTSANTYLCFPRANGWWCNEMLEEKKGNFSVGRGGGGVCIFGHLVFSFREKRRQPTATFLQYPIGIFVPLFHIQMCCVFLSPCVCVFVCVGYTNVVSCRPCLIFSLKFFCFWIVSIFGALWWVGDNEPVYSGRNLGSPGFGGPGGIFTYPSSTANSHHPVSSWNNVLSLI